MKDVKKRSIFPDIIAVLLPILLALMTYLDNIYLLYVILGGCLLFIGKPEVLLPVYICASLSSGFFAIGDGLSARRFISLLLILSGLLKFIKRRKPIRGNGFIWLIILSLFSFFSTLLGYDGSLEFFFIIIQSLIIFYLFSEFDDFDYEHLFFIITISIVFCIIAIVAKAIDTHAFLFSKRFQDLENGLNANNLAMMIEQCGAIMFAAFLFGKNKILNIIGIVFTVVCLVLVITTGSRSGLIGLVAAVLLGLFLDRRVNKQKFILALSLISILGIIAFSLISDSDSLVVARFNAEDVVESGGTYRVENNHTILYRILPDHLLFGSGMGGANMKALGEQYALNNLAHNIVVDPLSQMGVVGFLLFMCALYPVLKKSIYVARKAPNSFYLFPLLPLFAAISNGIGETVFYEAFFWNDLMLTVLAYNCIISRYGKI